MTDQVATPTLPAPATPPIRQPDHMANARYWLRKARAWRLRGDLPAARARLRRAARSRLAYQLGPMRSVCAWCQLLLRSGRLPISHGICDDCTARLGV